MLKINNLQIKILDKIIVDDINLTINDGEIHVLMGPNGVGKSSITKVLSGDKTYDVSGNIFYNGKDLNKMNMTNIAKSGIYLINQNPISIEGVTNAEMLRMVISENNDNKVDIFSLNKELEKICDFLELDRSFIHREINVGCSGGERKKVEMMHLWVLKPTLIILDEIDSGLDVDALNVVTKNIKKYYEQYKPSILIITHEERFIKNFDNYQVHILNNTHLVATGDKNLAKKIIKDGFKDNSKTKVINGNLNNE